MICRVVFGRGVRVSQEQLKKLELLLHKKLEVYEEQESPGLYLLRDIWSQYSVDPQDLMDLGVFGFEVVEKVSGPMLSFLDKIERQLNRLEATLTHAPLPFLSQAPPAPSQTFNAKCDVHVPGLGLLALNEVKVLEDCCTEELQQFLDEGWRIVAACPQPSSRRPDYVIGRHNPRF